MNSRKSQQPETGREGEPPRRRGRFNLRRRGRFNLRLPAMVGGGLWALSAKITSQIAQLTIFLVAARVLTPVEFGFFAMCSAIAIFLIVISEGGWAAFVMKTGDDARSIDQVATLSLLAGLLLTAVGMGISAGLAFGFGQKPEGQLLALFSCCVLPAALTTTYDGALVYHGRLRAQAAIRIAAEATGLGVGVFGLLAGWNVFALGLGKLTMLLLVLSGSVIAVGRVSRLRLERRFAGEVLEFSRHMLTGRLVLFLRSYSGTLALGSFLGLAEAGYYRAAERIVASFSELVGEPARMLGWIVFRRAADRGDGEEDTRRAMREAGNTFMPVLLAIAAPVYLGLAMVSPGLVSLALGDVWQPAALLVTILAAKQLLLIPAYVTEPLLAVAGHIRRLPRLAVVCGLIAVSLIVATAPFGVVAVALGQVVAAVLIATITVRVHRRYSGLDWPRIARESLVVAVAVLAMVCAVLLVDYLAASAALGAASTLGLQILAGASAYVAVLLACALGGRGTMFPGFLLASPK